MHKQPKHIVVLGAGFGGTYAFKELHQRYHADPSVRLTLINRTNYFLFTPLLHEVATGSVSPENVVEPLRKIFHCCAYNLFVGEVKKIHLAKQCVETSAGMLAYDHLVIALGGRTNFFNTPGAEKHAFTLKSLDDAIGLKAHVVRVFERAARSTDSEEQKRLLTFVIIGGGATGVELAAELAEYCFDTFAHYYAGAPFIAYIRIILVHKDLQLITQFAPRLRIKTAEFLKKKGVDIRCGHSVVKVEADAVVLDTGEEIPTHTPIWVAGVCPDIPASDMVCVQQNGRLIVRPTLQLADHERVYAIGDIASLMQDGRPLPALAQVAAKQAHTVAANIAADISGKSLRAFRYQSSGELLSLGQWMALAEIRHFTFWGHFAWWVWRTVYLSKLISWDHKIKVVVDWTLDIFSKRDIADV